MTDDRLAPTHATEQLDHKRGCSRPRAGVPAERFIEEVEARL